MDTTLTLFDDFECTDSSPAQHSEPQFAFIGRSARPRDARIRALLEAWFADYPANHRAELKRRFESGKTGQGYESAFYELSLHSLLRRVNCKVEVHPELPGNTKRPEFLSTEPDGREVFLEARLAGCESEAEASTNRLKDTVYDVLNRRIKTNDFFVDVSIRGTPKQQPSGATWLDSLKPTSPR